MYSHPFTAEHLESLQRKLGYLISGPQGAGMLACGDEGEYGMDSEGVVPDK
jgi:phosphopantothenoylcysteine decarboxylase